jgi:hypothetical protein
MRYIHLPAIERRVSLRQYVAAIRLAKANPNREFKHGLTCWWPCSGAEIVKQFYAGIVDRINTGIPYADRGARKDGES